MNYLIEQPEYLYAAIPLIIILFVLLKKEYVRGDPITSRKGKKVALFITRTLLILTLVLALANPLRQYTSENERISSITVLVDRSASMDVYEFSSLLTSLEEADLSVEIKDLQMEDYSSIGSAVLSHVEPEKNILLISDGQNNFGPSLSDINLFASSINARIYGLHLEPEYRDARIYIEGPSKAVADVENTYAIHVDETGKSQDMHVQAYVDEEIVLDTKYDGPIEIKRAFPKGVHTMRVELDPGSKDLFSQNNVFYKSVLVHDRPRILFVSKYSSPLHELYDDFYDVTLQEEIEDIDPYYAVVLNNMPSEDLSDKEIETLETYVADGNGLFVVGGKESYDWSNYNQSLINTLLPVSVGRAEKKKDRVNIVILMDTGESSKEALAGGLTHFDVQKSIVADIIRGISETNRVAMLETNYYESTLTPLTELGPKREDVLREISYLEPYGFSLLRFAYRDAHQMLRLNTGSKNIVIVTDGKYELPDQMLSYDFIKDARDDGIRTFIVAVGSNANKEFLMKVKELGDGEYFEANEKDKLRLYFGEPLNPTGDRHMFIYDSNHFITDQLDMNVPIYGFNTVFPKSTARMLLTSSQGDPLLTVWNYGLGRVASLSTDDGSMWVPDMLRAQNSKMPIKTLNWLIENPERKKETVIDIPPLRLQESSTIAVRSKNYPSEMNFYEEESGLYKAVIYPNETGFMNILGLPAAVNYKKEYQHLGISEDLSRALAISGGDILEQDTDTIIQRIKSDDQVLTTKTESFGWIFILIATAIYLVDIFIRRLYDMRAPR